MAILENINSKKHLVLEICFKIATLFGLGERFYGVFVATMISLPLVFLFNFVAQLIPYPSFLWMVGSLLFVSLFVIFLALRFVTDKDKTTIVLNNTIGMIFVFIGIPLKIKLMVTGFISFHIFTLLAPFVLYRLFSRRAESLPSYLAPLFADIMYGITANLFLKLIIWLAV